MKIKKISVYQKDLPLSEPYWLSGGRLKFEVLDATFVKIETDSGHIGWGEGTPWGHTYVPAHGPGIRAGIETIASVLIGMDSRQNERIEYVMDKELPGHPYVKSPIDMACLDIAGQAAGLFLRGAAAARSARRAASAPRQCLYPAGQGWRGCAGRAVPAPARTRAGGRGRGWRLR